MRLRSSSSSVANILALCLLVVSFCSPAAAQVDTSEWPTVRFPLYATVSGDPLPPELKVDSLRVREGGKAVTLESVVAATDAQSVCLLIDSSSSMKKMIPAIQAAAGRILQSLPAADEVCVAAFDQRVLLKQPLTMQRSDAVQSLATLQAGGGTAVYDALIVLEREMRAKAHNQSRVIVLLTDGDDNYSHALPEDVKKLLEAPGGATVDLLQIPEDRLRSGTDTVRNLSKALGGVACVPTGLQDMEPCATRLAGAMQNRYLVAYVTEQNARDGRLRRLEVEPDKSQYSKKMVLSAPEGFNAPSH